MKVHPWILPGFYLLAVITLEVLQIAYEQDFETAGIDILFFSSIILLVFHGNLSSFYILISFVYLVLESYSYYSLNATIDYGFLTALLDLEYAVKDQPGLLLQGIQVTIAVIIFSFIPRKFVAWLRDRAEQDAEYEEYEEYEGYYEYEEEMEMEMEVEVEVEEERLSKLSFVLVLLSVFVGYFFTRKVRKGLVPVGGKTWVLDESEHEHKAVDDYSAAIPVVKTKPGAIRKNLIYFVGESLELQVLGKYNERGYTQSMPFLSSLAENSMFCPEFIQHKYAEWSTGSLFTTQCGVPMIVKDSRLFDMFSGQRGYNCLGDILNVAGYHMVCLYPGLASSQGFYEFLATHGWYELYDESKGVDNDDAVMRRLPDVVKGMTQAYFDKGTNFAVLLFMEDTHPPFRVPCKPRLEYSGPTKGLQSFDCMDQKLEEIMKILKSVGLNETNTEFVIHGDHTIMFDNDAFTKRNRFSRKLFTVFPFQKKEFVNKTISHYDIVPTIFDHLGLEHNVPFPFGVNIHSKIPGKIPSEDAYEYMYRKFTSSRKYL